MLSLIRTGMPCSGPRGPCALARRPERVAMAQRVRIDLDDRSQRRSLPIDLLDPVQVELGDLSRGVSSRRHPLGELGGGRFLERKRW